VSISRPGEGNGPLVRREAWGPCGRGQGLWARLSSLQNSYLSRYCSKSSKNVPNGPPEQNSVVWLGDGRSHCCVGARRTDQRQPLGLRRYRPISTRGFRALPHSKDVASVRETFRRFSHTYYLCFQHEVSFVAPLGLLHQQCVAARGRCSYEYV
jgi:hypothetical protein